MAASVDFLREVGRDDRFALPIAEVLYIEDEDGPDVALLKIEGVDTGPSRSAIPLAGAAAADQQIAVIGYPARDSRIPDQPLMQSIFGEVYDAKRLAPGQVIGVDGDVLQHDCSTLGGNSGSVLIDLSSGAAVGLHFAGRFLEANYAVPAPLVAERVDRVLSRRPRSGAPPPRNRRRLERRTNLHRQVRLSHPTPSSRPGRAITSAGRVTTRRFSACRCRSRRSTTLTTS
jgi:endonuclease G